MGGRKIVDALELIDRAFPPTKRDLALQEEARADSEVAQIIHDARTAASLTQRQLAERVGTSASVICQLEDADYRGHSLAMLRRVAAALGKKVVVRFEEAPPFVRRRSTKPTQESRTGARGARTDTPRTRSKRARAGRA